MDNLRVWLQAELDRRNWSGPELARKAGINHQSVGRALKEETIGANVARAIAEALNAPVETVCRIEWRAFFPKTQEKMKTLFC